MSEGREGAFMQGLLCRSGHSAIEAGLTSRLMVIVSAYRSKEYHKTVAKIAQLAMPMKESITKLFL